MKGMIHTCTVRHSGGYQQDLSFTGPTGTAVIGQTVTGTTSHATAVIVTVSNPLVVKPVTGTFTAGEAISTLTWSATLGTQSEHFDSYGELVPDTTDTANVACKFYNSKDVIKTSGQSLFVESTTRLMLPPTVTVVEGDQSISTMAGFVGTWTIHSPALLPGPGGVAHHWECDLAKAGA